jgi:hypothetical protein
LKEIAECRSRDGLTFLFICFGESLQSNRNARRMLPIIGRYDKR